MKNLMKLALVALVVVALNACKSSDKPDAVAEKFLKAIDKCDTSEAKSLSTDRSVDMIRMSCMFGKLPDAKENKIENMKCTEKGDTAKCDYSKNGTAADSPLVLIKKDGKWLVDFVKENPFEKLQSNDMNNEPDTLNNQGEGPKEGEGPKPGEGPQQGQNPNQPK